jgi:hypothetical protein
MNELSSLGLIANNIRCLTAYSLAGTIIDLTMVGSGGKILSTLYRSGYMFVGQQAGSAALRVRPAYRSYWRAEPHPEEWLLRAKTRKG